MDLSHLTDSPADIQVGHCCSIRRPTNTGRSSSMLQCSEPQSDSRMGTCCSDRFISLIWIAIHRSCSESTRSRRALKWTEYCWRLNYAHPNRSPSAAHHETAMYRHPRPIKPTALRKNGILAPHPEILPRYPISIPRSHAISHPTPIKTGTAPAGESRPGSPPRRPPPQRRASWGCPPRRLAYWRSLARLGRRGCRLCRRSAGQRAVRKGDPERMCRWCRGARGCGFCRRRGCRRGRRSGAEAWRGGAAGQGVRLLVRQELAVGGRQTGRGPAAGTGTCSAAGPHAAVRRAGRACSGR